MDRREAARWQLRRAQRDLLIWITVVGSAIVVVVAILISAARADNLRWTLADCPRLLSVINDPDAPPRIKAMVAGKMSELKCPVRPWL